MKWNILKIIAVSLFKINKILIIKVSNQLTYNVINNKLFIIRQEWLLVSLRKLFQEIMNLNIYQNIDWNKKSVENQHHAPYQTRTGDLCIISTALCQLS